MSDSSWDTTALGDSSQFKLLSGLWKGKKPPFTRTTVIRNTNFADRTSLDLSDVAVLDVETRQLADRRLQNGDIIIERSGGGPKQPVGRPAYFHHENGQPFSFSNFTSVVRVLDQGALLPRFVAYYLLHLYQLGETIPLQRATTGIRNLDWSAYTELLVARPPIADQRRIAAVLSLVERAIENEEKALTATRELKRVVQVRLFTRGLHDEASRDTEVGALPESWRLEPIRNVTKYSSGGTPSRSVPEYWVSGTIPWVKTGEIDYRTIDRTEEFITEAGLANSAARVLPAGTVLVAMYGQGITRGKVAILGIDATTNQACLGLNPNTDELSSRFLYHYLAHSYDRLRALSHGAQQQNLNADLVTSFLVPLPTKEEQGEIVNSLDAIDAMLSWQERRFTALRDLFGALLNDLMTGKLRVENLDVDTSTNAA